MVYAGFWPRFCAGFIDALVLLPFVLINSWLGSFSKPAAMLFVVPISMFYPAYEIYFHGHSGQTIGKRALGIRVTTLEGGPISWSQAWVRSSVGIAFTLLSIVATLIAYSRFPDAQYNTAGWTKRQTILTSLYPTWGATASTASYIWVWSEVLVVLFNKKRRALHDFMAGTVVIDVKQSGSASPQANVADDTL